MPEEVLTDNGKQFTDRFGKGGEVLFDRICRDNAIIHRLTAPRIPTTTGKVERFHGSLRRELLDDAVPFADLAAAQAAVDAWVSEYNTTRPHQALSMASPAERFTTAKDSESRAGAAAAAAARDLVPAARGGRKPRPRGAGLYPPGWARDPAGRRIGGSRGRPGRPRSPGQVCRRPATRPKPGHRPNPRPALRRRGRDRL